MSDLSPSNAGVPQRNPHLVPGVHPKGIHNPSHKDDSNAAQVALIETLSKTKTAHCYKCGKCTAGCPVSENMEIGPSQLIRLLQLGNVDKALRSNSIWQCVSCLTCSSRCPKEVDCAAIMDALREVSLLQNKVSPEAQQIVTFQRAFLDNIRRNGRLNELDLIARFKSTVALRTRELSFLFKDASLAPQLRRLKKLHLSPARAKDLSVVDRIFARCQEVEK